MEYDQTPIWHVCQFEYFPRRLRIRSELTRRQYRFAVGEFAAMLGRTPVVLDLNDDSLCDLIHFMERRRLAAKTINERVGRLKTLWVWLWRKGLVRCGPTVEKIPEPIRTPRAWSEEELFALFAAARKMPGRVAQFNAGAWWFAILATAWYTGERITALRHVRWEMLSGCTLHVPGEIRKGGRKDAVYTLPPELMVVLLPLSGTGLIFPWPWCDAVIWLHYDRLLKLAGLPTGRYNKFQKIRRSHGTWVRIMGGDPTASLGHDDPMTFRKHYDDPSLGRDAPPLFRPWGD